MSRFTAGLLKTAMKNLYEHEKASMQAYTAQLEQRIQQQGSITDYIVSLPGDNLVQMSERTSSHISQSAADMHIIKTDTPQGTPSGPPRVNDQSQSVAYSPCDSVQVISLKSGHSQKLPALVTLINAFLHFQTSNYVH